jgi:hypothetical protein
MGVIRKFLGPKSKYDKSIPYTYMARVPVLEGESDLYNFYFGDTICALIEYLDNQDIEPEHVELLGLYKKEEIPIEVESCISKDGKWLKRPNICKSLEEQYRNTLQEKFKGHVEIGSCDYEDRERKGSGPY